MSTDGAGHDDKPAMSPADYEALRKEVFALLDPVPGQLRKGAKLLGELIRNTAESPAKGRLRQRYFETLRALSPNFPYASQAGQDRFLNEEFFRGKRDGTFVEVGGYDGVTGSNCRFFERELGWRGVIIEPSPRLAAQARARRASPVLQVAAGDKRGQARFLDIHKGYTQMGGLAEDYDPKLRTKVEQDPRFEGEEITVEMRPLADILAEHGLDKIDYMSIDVEGAEARILSSFPFDRYDVTVWSVENNTGTDAPGAYLRAAGYDLIAYIGVDEIWTKAP